MADLKEAPDVLNLANIHRCVETRVVHYADSPIDFETFLDYAFATGHDVELVNGVMVERGTAASVLENGTAEGAGGAVAAQLTHEKLFSWLHHVMRLYAKRSKS